MNLKEKTAIGDFYWKGSESRPDGWTSGAFHGNGVLGCMVYFTEHDGKSFLHLELGCNNVYDRRKTRNFWMAKQFDNPRLPIGYLEYPVENLYDENEAAKEFEMHTDIYNGLTSLSVKKVNSEEISCRFYVCAEAPAIIIEQEQGDEGAWRFTPREAVSPRQSYGTINHEEYRTDPSYKKNVPPKVSVKSTEKGRKIICVQELAQDYRTVTVCQFNKSKKTVFITIDQAQGLDVEAVCWRLRKLQQTRYKEAHQKWWNKYYEVSGLEIPDKELLKFYWRQIYKLGCAVRRESRALDNQGPWLSITPWPGNWWNLNVQLAYWPLYTSGRLEQAESLNLHLKKYQNDLTENVDPEYRSDSSGIGTNTTCCLKSRVADPLKDNGAQFVELGNLVWILHDCWLYYRMTMNREMLLDFLYPLLKRSVNYYLHFVRKGTDGKWHLPPTDSPEYGERCEDCNYDLSLLKWGCETLLDLAEKAGIQDEKEEMWEDICKNLVSFPTDETGYMIGKDLPYAKTHRHFSHLMMHVPLYLVNRENSDSWGLLKKSVDHWFSYQGDILGFSYVGASLMYSAYQKGSEALEYIRELCRRYITENSMYREAGPVIETPLAAAECIQQMLLQSWGGKVRVFPAMPEEWSNAAFYGFAAQGGFRVSAAYEAGKTVWIDIESLAGEPCIVETDMEQAEIIYENKQTEKCKIPKFCVIDLKAGEKVRLKNIAI